MSECVFNKLNLVVCALCVCGNAIGNTPLHYACLNGHIEPVKALLAAGADPEKHNKSDKSPIYEAILKEHNQLVDELMKGQCVYNFPLCPSSTYMSFLCMLFTLFICLCRDGRLPSKTIHVM